MKEDKSNGIGYIRFWAAFYDTIRKGGLRFIFQVIRENLGSVWHLDLHLKRL